MVDFVKSSLQNKNKSEFNWVLGGIKQTAVIYDACSWPTVLKFPMARKVCCI